MRNTINHLVKSIDSKANASNFMKLILILVCFFTISNNKVFASGDTLRPRYGANFGLGMNLHSAMFKGLPGVPSCCPNYTSANGISPYFGLFYQKDFSDNFYIGANLGYNSINGDFLVEEANLVAINNEVVNGVSEHSLKTSFGTINFSPYISYKIDDNLFVKLGLSLMIPISKSYEQKEELKSPSEKGVFYDPKSNTKSRTRNVSSGDIIDVASTFMSLNVGVSYDLPLNTQKTSFLSPELSFSYGMTNYVKDLEWKSSAIKLGVNYTLSPFETIYIELQDGKIDTIKKEYDYFRPKKVVEGIAISREDKKESKDTVFTTNFYRRTDTLFYPANPPINLRTPDPNVDKPATYSEVVKPKPAMKLRKEENINLDLICRHVDADKVEKPDLTDVKVQVEVNKDVYPIIPYIFFEEQSPVIPNRYIILDKASNFDMNEIEPSPIEYHRNNLNIIGARMKQNPNYKITIKGYTDPSTENGNCNLAKLRAESVRNYLTSRFNIEAERLVIKVSEQNCIPNDITRSQSDEGYAENRRVEIEANDPLLLSSVSYKKYVRPDQLDPATIEIVPSGEIVQQEIFEENGNVNSSKNVAISKWDIELSQDDKIFMTNSFTSPLSKIDFKWKNKDIRLLEDGKPVKVKFTAYSNSGSSKTIEKEYPVSKDTLKYEKENLTLTVFGVSQFTIDERNKKDVKNFMKNLSSDAEIIVIGYSDNLGDYNDNKRLASTRANSVKDYIRSIAPNAKIKETKATGSDTYPPGVNSYMTPEERFICRTVEIQIIKELKK